jgi:Tfp pilus assembly protein FimT
VVELMVTVAIVGILAGISVVTFTRNWRDERVKAATRETTGWLDEVRRIAIQKATPCRVSIDRANASLALDADGGTDDTNTYCADTLYASLDLHTVVQNGSSLLLCTADLANADPASYALSCNSSQTGSSNLVFTPRGTVTSGLLIKLHMDQANTDRCIAVMAPLGQIRSGRATSSGCDFKTAY